MARQMILETKIVRRLSVRGDKLGVVLMYEHTDSFQAVPRMTEIRLSAAEAVALAAHLTELSARDPGADLAEQAEAQVRPAQKRA